MRICLVCCEYPPGPHGGGGTFTQVLARALVRAGHEVRVIGIYGHQYPAADYQEDRGVKVWRLREPKHRLGWIHGRIMLYRKISRWARQGSIDLVEVPDWQGWSAFWPRMEIPVVARLNGSASYFASDLGTEVRRTTFWLERLSMRRADYWCSVSQYTAEKTRQLFQLASGPDAILYNPVEPYTDRFGVARSRFDVVYSGTLTEKKGIVSLFKAWPQVFRQSAGLARLHIYGKDGRHPSGDSMQARLLSMLDDLQRRSVEFHGHVDRARLFEALRRARLAVFPSYSEAFAIAPLEAMSTGCPTIYTRRGSGTELIDDNENGMLIDPDDADEIATTILRLIENDSLADRIGKAGQMLIGRRFADHILLQHNVRFYERCCGIQERPVVARIPQAPQITSISNRASAVESR